MGNWMKRSFFFGHVPTFVHYTIGLIKNEKKWIYFCFNWRWNNVTTCLDSWQYLNLVCCNIGNCILEMFSRSKQISLWKRIYVFSFETFFNIRFYWEMLQSILLNAIYYAFILFMQFTLIKFGHLRAFIQKLQ
jgi:hypothetical protein